MVIVEIDQIAKKWHLRWSWIIEYGARGNLCRNSTATRAVVK